MGNTLWTKARNTNGSTSELRSWGSAISAALATAGLIKTADTGQVDWTTINYNATQGALLGYEIWRFNDGLQATRPVFIKVWYYNASSTIPPNLRILFTVGSATDGVGNVSGYGNYGAFGSGATIGGIVTTPYYNLLSGDGSGIAFSFMADDTSADSATLLVIDRFRNSAGVALGDGILFAVKTKSATSMTYLVLDGDNGYHYNYARGCSLLPLTLSAGTTMLVGGNTFFTPYYIMKQLGNGLYYSKMMLCYAAADYGFNTTQSIPFLGATRTYKTLGVNMQYCDAKNQQYASAAMWWSD